MAKKVGVSKGKGANPVKSGAPPFKGAAAPKGKGKGGSKAVKAAGKAGSKRAGKMPA